MLSGAKRNRNISDFSGRLRFLASLGMTLGICEGICEIFKAQALRATSLQADDPAYPNRIGQRAVCQIQHQIPLDPHVTSGFRMNGSTASG